jgi:NAD-dependent deacetylase
MKDNKIVVVTGAGISVESGIQPFRGANGIWEENPMEMATFAKYSEEPAVFLSWYYHRFVSCRHAMPNPAHQLLALQEVKVITQNIDGLHRKANHPSEKLIEIHGCLSEKRIVNSILRSSLIEANWDLVDENDLEHSLFQLFNIDKTGVIDYEKSYRPHVLLFDEFYSDLYEYEQAIEWVLAADTVIFMGTSNSVGITEGILRTSLNYNKEIIVVDPNPAPSFRIQGVMVVESTATKFCRDYFTQD